MKRLMFCLIGGACFGLIYYLAQYGGGQSNVKGYETIEYQLRDDF